MKNILNYTLPVLYVDVMFIVKYELRGIISLN
jgi:hypothetical protein